MAKLWPLPSSTVVSARRTVRAGMVSVPPRIGTLTAPVLESWLTSGRTRRLSRVGDSTVGTTARLTPNCLNSTVIVAEPLLVVPAIGTGNSPPGQEAGRSRPTAP